MIARRRNAARMQHRAAGGREFLRFVVVQSNEQTRGRHHARVRRAIVDKGVRIPPRCKIGYDPRADARRFVMTTGGVCVVSRGMQMKTDRRDA